TEDIEQSEIEVDDLQCVFCAVDRQCSTPGNHHTCHNCRHHRDARTQDKQRFVCNIGDDLFLHEHLDPVGQRLEQSKRTRTVRTDAILYKRGYLTLEVGGIHRHQQHDAKHAQHKYSLISKE